MASSSPLILIAISSLLALLSSHLALAQPTAPAPSPPGPLNFTGILDKAGGYSVFLQLLTQATQVAKQIDNQLNTSTQGLTIFAPTDNAFNNLEAGTLNKLTPQQQVELLLYHVLPQYYTADSLLSVSNPVRTQANFGLNFTGKANQLNVTTGLVETQIYNAMYQKFPLAMYQVDKVLLPPELFAPSPASAPASPKSSPSDHSSNTTTSSKAPSSSENSNSGAEGKNLLMGLIFGVLSISMGVLF